MYGVIVVIHVIISIFLIAVILLQAGRGGGLADSFGGSQMQNLFGTKSATVLTRLTTICASLFIITCLSLAIMSGYRSRSLIENVNLPGATEPIKASSTEKTRPEATPVQSEPTAEIPVPTVAATTTVPAETQGGTDEAK